MIVKLSKPIMIDGLEQVNLDFRLPTIDDVVEIGYPFLIVQTDNGFGVQLQPKVVMKYASRLAGVPPSALRGLSLGDLSELQAAIMGFFGDEAGTSQS
jgi:hypothetical protein